MYTLLYNTYVTTRRGQQKYMLKHTDSYKLFN